MRKAISITFILLANLVILAHVVIPHHHAEQGFASCDLWHHNHTDDSGSCVHFTETVSRTNNCDSHKCLNIEDCLLEEIYIRFANHGHVHQITDSGSGHPLLLLYFSSGNNVQIEPGNNLKPFLRKPYLESFYALDFTQSKGLRAPPFC